MLASVKKLVNCLLQRLGNCSILMQVQSSTPASHSRPLEKQQHQQKQQQQQKLEIISSYRVHAESKNAHGANPLIIEVP